MATVSGRAWDFDTGATQDGVTVNVGALLSASADQLVFAGAEGDETTGGKTVTLHIGGGYRGSFTLGDAQVAKPPVTGQDPNVLREEQPASATSEPEPEPSHHWWDK